MEYPNSVNKIVDTVTAVIEHQIKLDALLSSGPASYYLEKIKLYADVLFNKFSPFTVGSKIKLNKDVGSLLTKDSGWYCYRKMLYLGATGTVQEVDINSNKKFVAYVIFDEEFSVNDSESAKYYKEDDKGLFCFSEDDLEVLDKPLDKIKDIKLSAMELASLALERFSEESGTKCKGFSFVKHNPHSMLMGAYGGYEEAKKE